MRIWLKRRSRRTGLLDSVSQGLRRLFSDDHLPRRRRTAMGSAISAMCQEREQRRVMTVMAVDDGFGVNQNSTISPPSAGSFGALVGNDFFSFHGINANGQPSPFTVSLESGPQHGSVTLNANGSFSYTPDPDYVGPDSFEYQLSDIDNSDTATVTLQISDFDTTGGGGANGGGYGGDYGGYGGGQLRRWWPMECGCP